MVAEKIKAGFSLVELLIVIVIIGILTSISVLIYSKYKVYAYNSSALYDLKNLINDELSFFSIKQHFVSFSVSDINQDGTVKVDGFEHKYISKYIRATSKTDGNYANFCTKHDMGNKIYAYQSETDTIYYKTSQQGYKLQDSDCPNATSGNDFSPEKGWKILAQSK